jgi:hypothetical protein
MHPIKYFGIAKICLFRSISSINQRGWQQLWKFKLIQIVNLNIFQTWVATNYKSASIVFIPFGNSNKLPVNFLFNQNSVKKKSCFHCLKSEKKLTKQVPCLIMCRSDTFFQLRLCTNWALALGSTAAAASRWETKRLLTGARDALSIARGG